jgi:DNA-3-methyladenine glycosylase II
MTEVSVHPRAPFDFGPMLRYLGRSPIEPLDVVEGDRYRRALRLHGEPHVVEARSVGSVDRPELCVRVLGVDDRALAAEAGRLIARQMRTDDDHGMIDAAARDDRRAAELTSSLRGARAALSGEPFEALIWAILAQQINIVFAYKLKRRVVERYGSAIEREGRTYWLMPTAGELADATEADLRDLQFSRQKLEYTRSLSRAVVDGVIDWDRLRPMETEGAVRELTALHGIGRWTAEVLCMRALGHTDVFPAGDLGLRAALGRLLELGRHATEAEARAITDAWRGWRSHAAFCLWFSLMPGRGAT